MVEEITSTIVSHACSWVLTRLCKLEFRKVTCSKKYLEYNYNECPGHPHSYDVGAKNSAKTKHKKHNAIGYPCLAFCVAFLRLVVKKNPSFLVINLCVSRINATQSLASLCEPALSNAQVPPIRVCTMS